METHLVIISPKRSVSPVPHELTAATCIIVFLASFVEYLGVTVDLQHCRIAVCFNAMSEVMWNLTSFFVVTHL